MSTPELQLLVTRCGMRLRRIAESRDWQSGESEALQQMFGEVAAGGNSSVEILRQLMFQVGVRGLDGASLQGLSSDDLQHFWRGYYGQRRLPADPVPTLV
jgi:hypothetical protein